MRQRDIHSHLNHRETQPRHLRGAGRDGLLQPGGGRRTGPNGPRRKKKNPAPTLELKKYPSPLGLERELKKLISKCTLMFIFIFLVNLKSKQDKT